MQLHIAYVFAYFWLFGKKCIKSEFCIKLAYLDDFGQMSLKIVPFFDDFALHEFENRANFDDFAQMRLKIAPLFIIANKVLQGGSEYVEGRLCYGFSNFFS